MLNAITAVTVDKKCRVRLYASAEKLQADILRKPTEAPTLGTDHGVILDIVFDKAKTWTLSPIALVHIPEDEWHMLVEPAATVKFEVTFAQ